MKHLMKRYLAILIAAMTVGTTVSAMSALTAAAAEQPSILILGDSISTGYGLAEGETCFTEYLKDYTGSTMTNLAVNGMTTDGLIQVLDKTANADSIKSADIICISIGANDLLKPTRNYFNSLRKEGETTMQLLTRLASEGKAADFISNLTNILREPRSHAVENYPVIAEKLRTLNPDARIIMQTIYNPYEIPERFFTANNHTESDYEDYTLFVSYVKGNLSQLNKAMAKLDGVEIADVAAAYAGAGWVFCGILDQDVHPTALGHSMIAAVLMDMIGGNKKTFPEILPLVGDQYYSDYLCINAKYRSALMKYTEGELNGLLGDANSDNSVQIDDAQVVLNLYVDIMAAKSVYGDGVTYRGYQFSDINGDKSISVEDAQYILNYYVENTIAQNPTTWDQIIGK